MFACFFTDLQVTTSMAALGDVGSDAPLRFAMLSASASAPSKGSVDAAGYGLCQNSQGKFRIGLCTGKEPLHVRSRWGCHLFVQQFFGALGFLYDPLSERNASTIFWQVLAESSGYFHLSVCSGGWR